METRQVKKVGGNVFVEVVVKQPSIKKRYTKIELEQQIAGIDEGISNLTERKNKLLTMLDEIIAYEQQS